MCFICLSKHVFLLCVAQLPVYSTSDEGSFLFISYKIEAYGWPVPQGM